MSPSFKMLIGLAVTTASAWVFHAPAGYGRRLIDGLDAQVQPVVARQELPTVTASFVGSASGAVSPLSRDLLFKGPANAFQRKGFVDAVQEENIRGLRSVGWDPTSPVVQGSGR